MATNPRYGLVAIAASGGGIPALRRVLWGLPGDFPLPIAVVQHAAIASGAVDQVLPIDRIAPTLVEPAGAGSPWRDGEPQGRAS